MLLSNQMVFSNANDTTRSEAMLLLAMGVLIFFHGFGNGEMRRFLWRMCQIGETLAWQRAQIPKRTNLQLLLKRDRFASAGFLYAAIIFIPIAFGEIARTEEANGSQDLLLLVMALAAAACSYGFYRLTANWVAMIGFWETASDNAVSPVYSRLNNMLRTSAWVLGSALMFGGTPFIKYRSYRTDDMLVIVACGALLIFWLGQLKNESHRFLGGVRGLCAPAQNSVPRRMDPLTIALITIAIIRALLAYVFETASNQGGFNGGLRLFDGLGSLTQLRSAILTIAFPVLFPTLWLVAMYRDLECAVDTLKAQNDLAEK